MSSLTVAKGVGVPPAAVVSRFRTQMRNVARTWQAVAQTGVDLQITSWYRSRAKNEATPGSADYSQHLLGCAMDAVSRTPGVNQAELLRRAQAAAARFGTTALVSQRGAVHVQGLPQGYVRAIAMREPRMIALAGTLAPTPVRVSVLPPILAPAPPVAECFTAGRCY